MASTKVSVFSLERYQSKRFNHWWRRSNVWEGKEFICLDRLGITQRPPCPGRFDQAKVLFGLIVSTSTPRIINIRVNGGNSTQLGWMKLRSGPTATQYCFKKHHIESLNKLARLWIEGYAALVLKEKMLQEGSQSAVC